MSRGAEVFWLEQTIAEVPATDEWLAPAELEKLRTLRVPKRASDWRLGRWTAKRALAHSLHLPDSHVSLATIEILPAASGAPLAYVADEPCGWNISLSHSNGRAACAATPGSIAIGCDIERMEAHTDAFVADYFTDEEQDAIAHSPHADRKLLQTLYWSAKESALKMLGEGLRLDTRAVSVERIGCPSPWSAWTPLAIRIANHVLLEGWWRADGNFVRTITSDPVCSTPVSIAGIDVHAFTVTHAAAD